MVAPTGTLRNTQYEGTVKVSRRADARIAYNSDSCADYRLSTSINDLATDGTVLGRGIYTPQL